MDNNKNTLKIGNDGIHSKKPRGKSKTGEQQRLCRRREILTEIQPQFSENGFQDGVIGQMHKSAASKARQPFVFSSTDDITFFFRPGPSFLC